MWKHALATFATATALLAGAAVPAAVAAAPAGPQLDATSHVAAARAVALADERLTVSLATAADHAAAAAVEQRRAEAAARAEAERVAAERAAQEAAEAAADQAAAAQRAADEAAATEAAARAAGTKKPAKAPAALPAAGTAPAAPAAPVVAWSTRVVDSGGQDAVDACRGGLTHWFEDVDGKPYYPIHRGCGGTPILGLHLGDLVRIDGALWTVTDSRDVPKGAHYDAAAGLNGQILLQTCYRNDATMRIVALTAA